MAGLSKEAWESFGRAYAFVGNSLLAPMSKTSDAGLDPGFWDGFPDFGDDDVRAAAEACGAFARRLGEQAKGHDDAPAWSVSRVSTEYTRLFIGPPSPAAAPWETAYRSAAPSVGFGQATFEMRALLRGEGLELRNENRQYEDHMGIELLLLSELCRKASEEAEQGSDMDAADRAEGFINTHPLVWIGALEAKISEVWPDGYFRPLVGLATRVMEAHLRLL